MMDVSQNEAFIRVFPKIGAKLPKSSILIGFSMK